MFREATVLLYKLRVFCLNTKWCLKYSKFGVNNGRNTIHCSGHRITQTTT